MVVDSHGLHASSVWDPSDRGTRIIPGTIHLYIILEQRICGQITAHNKN